jgi:hypothetical protein
MLPILSSSFTTDLCEQSTEMFDVLVHHNSNILAKIKSFTLDNCVENLKFTDVKR